MVKIVQQSQRRQSEIVPLGNGMVRTCLQVEKLNGRDPEHQLSRLSVRSDRNRYPKEDRQIGDRRDG
jgi:hypothetical protein